MKVLLFFVILIALSSCYKKKDSFDKLNDNIFDELYAGDKWFSFHNYSTVNDSIETYVDFKIHDELFTF